MKSFTLCLATLLITLTGPASADSQSGTLTFRGTITNGSCDIDTGDNRIVVNCYDPARGKAVSSTADLTKPQSLAALPVDVKMEWFNPEKTKGLLNVNYL